MCEEKESAEMSRLAQSFWEGGLTRPENGHAHVDEEIEEAEEEEWEREVVDSLESLGNIIVDEG